MRSWVTPLPVSALISERWLRLRGAAHSSDRMAADIDVNWSGVATDQSLACFSFVEIKLINLTVFSSAFFSCTYITHCHRTLVHSSFWTPLRSLTGLCLRDCTWLYLSYSYTTINLIKLIKLIYTYKKQNPELYHCRWCNCWFYKFSSVVWQKICNVKW